jgi:hypothetical protein
LLNLNHTEALIAPFCPAPGIRSLDVIVVNGDEDDELYLPVTTKTEFVFKS